VCALSTVFSAARSASATLLFAFKSRQGRNIFALNVALLPPKGYLFAANVYQQDELRGV
jgi:hypothetical protein